VDLRKRFRLEAAMDRGGKEMLLNIDHEDGSPESFFFSFHAVGDAILALGRNDPFETEHVRKQLLAVNRELSNLSRQLQKKKVQMEQALEHIKALQGVIPICMHCRKIRNDQQIWERVEAYIEEHSDAKMSHSLCPDCAAELYRETPELDESSA
jgi:chromosome condensin MukBEF ATPase and DNA-binding subunit MukB